MNPRVKDVKANPDYTLTITFQNGEVKIFNVEPYLDKGIFRELKDLQRFNSVRPSMGTVRWENGQDFCPDTLYLESVPAAGHNSMSGSKRAYAPSYS
ncbi:MAG TPA: DUF2442 domain-containing protein [Bacteroidetes bacterium]|nr:DUF2442 domain-containing protein [Bacteroidota bacterium]